MKKYLFIFILAVLLLFTIFSVQYFRFNDGKLHIVICDVGQGDSIFIRTPKGSDILIDGGPDDKVLSCLVSHMPFWDRTIEAIILTHPHADHLTGLIDVIDRYQVMSFSTEKVQSKSSIFKRLMSNLAEKNLSASYLYAGDVFAEGSDFKLRTEWPSLEVIQQAGQNTSNLDLDLNGFSVIELLTYEKFRMLFTGDAGYAVEEKIGQSVGQIDVLKVPHHGSRTGMSDSFIRKIEPKLAVISVGAKNRYGHPAQQTLDLLRNAGVKTLRTDLNGEIEIISDGNSYSYSSQR